jgi:hypothetical protein
LDPLTIETDGSFSVDVGAAVGTVSGLITGNSVTGTVSGLGITFNGTRSDPDGSASQYAGIYPLTVVNRRVQS